MDSVVSPAISEQWAVVAGSVEDGQEKRDSDREIE